MSSVQMDNVCFRRERRRSWGPCGGAQMGVLAVAVNRRCQESRPTSSSSRKGEFFRPIKMFNKVNLI